MMRLPNADSTEEVSATALPSASTTERCVVEGSSGVVSAARGAASGSAPGAPCPGCARRNKQAAPAQVVPIQKLRERLRHERRIGDVGSRSA